jgi:hypothetical protein
MISLTPERKDLSAMRILRRLLIVGWPILALVAWAWWSDGRGSRLGLGDPNAVVWGQGPAQVRVTTHERDEGETLHITAAAVDAAGRTLLEETLTVNRDMFGKGLATAVQADDDPELEVVVWGAHEAEKAFFLDYADGRVVRRPFREVSGRAMEAIHAWRQGSVSEDWTAVLAVLLTFAYWGTLFAVWLVGKASRRAPAVPAPPTPSSDGKAT